METKRTHKILVIDDDPKSLGVLGNILDQEDYELYLAADGESSLHVAEKELPDLILLDILMPDMDGFETCQRLKANPQLIDIPIIFLTAKTEMEDLEKGFHLGGVDYITKPFHARELLARIRTHLSLQDSLQTQKALSEQLILKNEEIEAELQIAQEVQRQLFAQPTQLPFLKITTQYRPYSHVSGDIYAVLPTANQSGANLFIGDGTGHGIVAALSTIMADMTLKQYPDVSPQTLMEQLNQIFDENLPMDRFMSAAYLKIKENGNMTFCNSGHPPIVILPANGDEALCFYTTGPVLGAAPNDHYSVSEMNYRLSPGDRGVLFTDGIYEQTNPDGKIFGADAFIDFLKTFPSDDLENLLSEAVAHVSQYTQNKPVQDDITLLAFQYIGGS